MSNRYNDEIVEPGDKASALAKDVCVESYGNNPAADIIPIQPGNFRGPVDFNWSKHVLQQMMEGKICQTVQNDGAGGKPQFFTIIGTEKVFFNLGWEIVVMVIDDIARNGGFPVIFSNDVNVKKVTEGNYHLIKAMIDGFGKILKEANLINITGEFAVMPHSITAFCDMNLDEQLVLNWAGTGIGLTSPDRRIDGSSITANMPVVGFWEPGYRCNGGTQHTNILMAHWGRGSIENILNSQEALDYVKKLTTPSKSYAKTICRANGWGPGGTLEDIPVEMMGVAHITGGGVVKFKEMLPPGVGAHLFNMPKPSEVLLQAQIISQEYPELKMSDRHAYTTFHGGCGMMVVCKDQNNAKKLIKLATEDGIKASIIGNTIKSNNNAVAVKSKFIEGSTVIL